MNKVYNRIESIVGNVITVRASDVQYKELAQIHTRFGKSLAQVNKIEGEVVVNPFSALKDGSMSAEEYFNAMYTYHKGQWDKLR